MFGNMSIQTIFIVLIGAAVFVLGTSNLRACLRLRRKGALITGKVMNARLVEKRDPQGKLTQHYYELTLSCHEGNNKTFQQKLNSTRQYEKGEEIKLIRNAGKITPLNTGAVSAGMGFAIAIEGMLLAVFPVVYNNAGEKQGSLILSALFLVGGLIALASYLGKRKKNLTEITGTITDVLYYKTEEKKLSKPVESYYPLIQYNLNGKERTFLSSYNSSRESTYKKDSTVTLYYDPETQELIEKKANPAMLVLTVALWIMAVVGIVSVL